MKYYLDNTYSHMQACSGGQASLECPEHLYLDLTQDCNLFCQMCRDKIEIAGRTMPFDLFGRLVDETSLYVKRYSLFNSGEPLLVEDFCERVAYVNARKRADCSIEISTNGMLLTDSMIGFLHSHAVSVIVSFDGADKETFEKIRRGANFERICGNLRKLADAYADTPIGKSPQIYVTMQKDNQGQLPRIAALAHSLGVRQMGFGLVNVPSIYAPDCNENLRAEIEAAAACLDARGMLNCLYPTRVGDYLRWGDRYVHMDHFLLDSRCPAPYVSAAVRYDGDVFVCCNQGEYVDNVSDKSFWEVWRGARFHALREAVNSEAMPSKCRQCWWVNR